MRRGLGLHGLEAGALGVRALALGGMAGMAALLAGCGTVSIPGSAPPPAEPQAAASPAAIQQFAVPPAGRAVLRTRLSTLLGSEVNAVSDASLSNAWRTTASAQQTPNDYAACVRATTPTGLHTYVLVVSGQSTGGLVSGPPAVQRCADPTRVAQWVPFTEAVSEPGL